MKKRISMPRLRSLFQMAACGLLAGFTLLAPLSAQADDADHELQSWNMVTLWVDAPHRLKLYGEVQSRNGFQREEAMDRLLLRGEVGYRVTPWLSVWQGYAWTPGFRPRFENENRLFQQLLLENNIGKLTVVNRSRLEERFIANAGATSLRFRHMLRLAYPLDKARKWSAVSYDELFVNLSRTPSGPQGGFDQNRIFVGLNRKLGEQVNAEIGYMTNLVNRRTEIPDKVNHIVLFTLNFVVK